MVWMQALVVATVFSAGGDTVMLDFYSDSCAPCRAMGPTIDALVEQGLPVRKVNISREPQLARQYGVTQVPCYVMVADGREVDRVLGTTTFSRLQRMFELAPSQSALVPSSALAALTSTPKTDRSTTAVPQSENSLPMGVALQQATAATWASRETPARAASDVASRNTSSPPDAALLAASVRLRIEDPTGSSCGSGTIIDARQGEALILTCGHVFRDSRGQGAIEVDLFGRDGVVQVTGNLVSYDLERDLGLVSIRPPGPVATVRVAPAGHRVAPGDFVVSVGCNNGAAPTAQQSRIASLDKFTGPPNLQVLGMPVEGRSGGGLFSDDGLLIGVCNAADPADQEGLYAALGSIHAALDESQVGFVYRTDLMPVPGPNEMRPATALAADAPPRMPERMPGRTSGAADPLFGAMGNEKSAPVATIRLGAPLAAEERAALDEIQRRLDDGAEVVCVIRSRRDPQAPSEVLRLDRDSTNALGQLAMAGGLREEAEVICIARSHHDPHARSEIFVLNQVSGNFLGELASLGQSSGESLLPTSLDIPRNRLSTATPTADAGGWEISGPDRVVRR